ncbi:hypothetical protein [Streptomyces chrestomyceticus]|uniref:Uncharacterized protein n=1 Tax=Streptomyces chrestomyceticus TaxID=68185 RepID=A0ABU7WQC1_9ACTN
MVTVDAVDDQLALSGGGGEGVQSDAGMLGEEVLGGVLIHSAAGAL